jgi:sentrin-specific protease 7
MYLFNTFFYERLSRKDGFENVKKWTAKVNLFEKKYIVVPIHYNAHWYMVIIYNLPYLIEEAKQDSSGSSPDEGVEVSVRATRNGVRRFVYQAKHRTAIDVDRACTLFILDSLKPTNHTKAISNLRDYIVAEAKDKLGIVVKRQLIERRLALVPQQDNFCDCGIYMIHFMSRFVSRPLEAVHLMAGGKTSRSQTSIDKLWRADLLPSRRESFRNYILKMKRNQELRTATAQTTDVAPNLVDELDENHDVNEAENDDIVILDNPPEEPVSSSTS